MKKYRVTFSVVFAFFLTFGILFSMGQNILFNQPIIEVATTNEIMQVQQRLKEFGYYWGQLTEFIVSRQNRQLLFFKQNMGLMPRVTLDLKH